MIRTFELVILLHGPVFFSEHGESLSEITDTGDIYAPTSSQADSTVEK